MTPNNLVLAAIEHCLNDYLEAPPGMAEQPPTNAARDFMRAAWMARHGVSECKARPSLHRVAPRFVNIGEPPWGGRYRIHWADWQHIPYIASLFDHVQIFWCKNKQHYVLTTQPYDARYDDLDALRRWCAEHFMHVSVSWDGWHYPGRCALIVIEPSEE
jgi:hypothetical protein